MIRAVHNGVVPIDNLNTGQVLDALDCRPNHYRGLDTMVKIRRSGTATLNPWNPRGRLRQPFNELDTTVKMKG